MFSISMKNKNMHKIIQIIRLASLCVFLVCAVYLGYGMVLRPYLSQKAVSEARNLYDASKENLPQEQQPENKTDKERFHSFKNL